MIIKTGSVRVDLTGGTIDLWPINFILSNVVTLNLATSLKAEVRLEKISADTVEIESTDYNIKKSFCRKQITRENIQKKIFGEMTFIVEILQAFDINGGVKLILKSGSPTGAGLGGSSAMGVALAKALCEHTGQKYCKGKLIKIVNSLEGKILNCGPPGYQDYYPALYGGILALEAKLPSLKVVQLYSPELKEFLEEHLTLIYSGQTRLSGINNWEVYKGFFDGDQKIRDGLEEIAEISFAAFQCIKNNSYEALLDLISREGELRSKLFTGITTPEMDQLFVDLKKEYPSLGMKVCGAGGGGCFLLIGKNGPKKDFLGHFDRLKSKQMEVLNFSIEAPLL